MKISVVAVALCGICLLSGPGVEAQQRVVRVGIPLAGPIVQLEAMIEMAIQLAGKLLGSLNGRASAPPQQGGGGGAPGGAAQVALALKGFFDAWHTAADQRSQLVGNIMVRVLRFINTIIARALQAIWRAASGIKAARLVKNADKLRENIKKLLGRFAPKNLLKLLPKLPNPMAGLGKGLRNFFGVFKKIGDLMGEYLRTSIYNAINNSVKNLVTGIASIPKNLWDSVKNIGKKLTTRPKPLKDLFNRLKEANKKARAVFFKGMKKALGLLFNILGRLTGYLIDMVKKMRERFRKNLQNRLTAIPRAFGKLGERLSRRGPLSRLFGFLVTLAANWVKRQINAFIAIVNAIESIINGVQLLIRRTILRILGFIWNSIYTIVIANKVVWLNNLGKGISNLIPKPGGLLKRLGDMLKKAKDKRRSGLRKLFDWFKNLLAKFNKNRPKIIPIIINRIKKIMQKQPMKNPLSFVFTVWKDLAAIVQGAIRIIFQLMLTFAGSGSGSLFANLLRFLNRKSKPTFFTRIAAVIELGTRIVKRISQSTTGPLKWLGTVFSNLLFAFEPYLRQH